MESRAVERFLIFVFCACKTLASTPRFVVLSKRERSKIVVLSSAVYSPAKLNQHVIINPTPVLTQATRTTKTDSAHLLQVSLHIAVPDNIIPKIQIPLAWMQDSGHDRHCWSSKETGCSQV